MGNIYDPTSIKGVFQDLVPKAEGIIRGIVISVSPLSIQIVNDEKRILNESQLIVPQNLTDFTVKMDIILSDGTLKSKTKVDGDHTHDYKGQTEDNGKHKHEYDGETKNSGKHGHSFNGNTEKSGSHGHDISGSIDSCPSHTHSLEIMGSDGVAVSTGETGLGGEHGHNFNASVSNSGEHGHSFQGNTQENGEHFHKYDGETAENGEHNHDYKGTTDGKTHSHELETFDLYGAKVKVYNSLKVDEIVYLLPYNESKKYYVLDRVQ